MALRNFVDDSYLESFYPDIINWRVGGQVDFSETIEKGFEFFVDDLESRGFNTRLCMVPLDLNRASTDDNLQYLKSKTLSVTGYGDAFAGNLERRFVVNVTAKTASTAWTFTLQGSNESDEPADDSTYWETVTTISSDAEDTTGEQDVKFTTKYRWYRCYVTLVTGTGSITYTASIQETIYDRGIALRALILLFSSWVNQAGDQFDARLKECQDQYDKYMAELKITYDADEDGVPEKTERGRSVGGRLGSISLAG